MKAGDFSFSLCPCYLDPNFVHGVDQAEFCNVIGWRTELERDRPAKLACFPMIVKTCSGILENQKVAKITA